MKNIDSLLKLEGQSAIVTGGAKGIGKGIAYRLAEAGANVLIADLDDAAINTTCEEFRAKGWRAYPYKIDVSIEADVIALVEYCKKELGSLNILVNNAGIFPVTPISNMSSEDFDKVISTNLRSTFLTTKYGSEVMKEAGGGKIINITSIDALRPSMVGLAHYDASKHGMWGFTKNSAVELAAHNIQVNAIAPGGIATPGVAAMSKGASAEQMQASAEAFIAKIPMHRMGEPDDIGKVALFLASDMSSYITGEQIVVDGGALIT